MSVVNKRRGGSKSGRSRRISRLESLEARTLLSAVTSYSLGTSASYGITHDGAGNVWVAGGDGLYEVGASGQQIAKIATDFSTFDLAFNPANGHLYFTDGNSQVVEFATNGTFINSYTVPTPGPESPQNLTVAGDGSIWFTTPGTGDATSYTSEIGHVSLSGVLTLQAVPGNVALAGISGAPDGSAWFGAYGVAGADGVTPMSDGGVGHAHAAANGAITVDPLYAISTPVSIVSGMTVESDTSVWFSLNNRGTGDAADGPNRLVHGVLSGGTLVQTEYVIPGATDAGSPGAGDLALDAGGRLWFTDQATNHLSFMDTGTGEFTQLAVPSSVVAPYRITITDTDVWTTGAPGGDDLLRLNFDSFISPVAATTPNINADTGTQYTATLVTFQSADNGPFNYTVDYGNGTNASGTLEQNASGMYTIPADVTYATSGTYNTVVTIASADGNSVSLLGTAVVMTPGSTPLAGQGINISGAEDTALLANRTLADGSPVLAVATFSGPAAAYTATITWGDSTASAGQIVDLGGGMYAVVVSGSKTYATNGSFAGSVLIAAGDNALTVGFTATISDTPLVVSTGMQLQTLNGRHFNGVVASFTDDVDSTASWFTAVITWGDGSTSTGVVVADASQPGGYSVLGQHLYRGKKATYTVLTLITNVVEGTSATATGTITV